MVFKGAGGRSAREISETIEDVGGDLNAATDRDSTVFSVSALPEHVALGVELIADMIRRPHFAADELDREKDVVLQELGEARDTPNDIIFDDLQAAAFADQPLGRSVLGEEDSIAAIVVDDLHHWRIGQYRAGGLSLVAAGKVDHSALVALAERWFGDLEDGTAPAPDEAHFTGGNRVGRGHGDQAHLALGVAGPAVLDENVYAARLFADMPVAAPRPDCSSSCARRGGSLIRSGLRFSHGAMPVSPASTRRRRATSRPRPPSSSRRSSRRRPQRRPSASLPGSRSRQKPHC
jgi:predicted Zn-dependent peptidase